MLKMVIEIINRNRHEHRQFKMAVNRKSIPQVLQSLFQFGSRLVHPFLADIFHVELIIGVHADLEDLCFGPTLLQIGLRQIVSGGQNRHLLC